jgi:hypothetical protein
MKAHFNALRNGGCTVSQVNKSIKVAKTFFTYAFDCEYVSSNVMQRHPKMQRVAGERKANRGSLRKKSFGRFLRSPHPSS